MTILKTKELVKIYKTKDEIIRALDCLDVEIPKGSTALLGPNGSGKSTLIKIILKLIKFNSGSFELFGYKSGEEHYSRNQIGYMPETPSIVTKVNALKFTRHFGILSGLSFTRAMQRAHEVLDYVGLDESRYREISNYSTGMKQRLLFAQSLVHDPELIILDEPTTGLSPEGRQEMLGLIKEITEEYGKSIIFSTHILPDVEKICDYTVLLNLGKCVFQGPLSKIGELHGDSLILEIEGDNLLVVSELEDLGYLAEIQGSLIKVNSNSGELPTFEILTKIIGDKMKLVTMRQLKANLEDLFLSLITKDIDQY